MQVQPIEGNQLDVFLRLVHETFRRVQPTDAVVARRRREYEVAQGREPSRTRGVLSDGTVIGGYAMHEREMCMGAARVPTACIAAVVTHPEWRGRGVGRVLMDDATAQAQERGLALLLLGGIARFYKRFGYADMFDATSHWIDRRAIPEEPCPGWSVRAAVVEDAPALHDLYRRHFHRYMGSFDWTVERFGHRLALWIEWERAPAVAVDPSGQIGGYLHRWGTSEEAVEVAVDQWPAALSLLQYHASGSEAPPGVPPSLRWRLPPDSPTLYLLAEHLQTVPDPEGGGGETTQIQSRTNLQRNAGWQARPGDWAALVQSFLLEWRVRWERSARPYRGPVALHIGSDCCSLALGATVELTESQAGPQVDLSSQAFTQLLCGYRPVWWFARQGGIPEEVRPALDVLFPPGGFWIPGTDWF